MIKGLSENKRHPPALEVRGMVTFISKLNKVNLVGVEIGVLYGIHADAMLRTLSIQKLYLVDPYITYPEYLDITSPFGWNAERHANTLFQPFQDKIVKLKKFSAEAVSEIPDELDFVYIDGNHAYEYCCKDILLYYPKLKKGGVLGGHDYYNQGKAREVKKAVDEFIEKNKLELHTSVGGHECDWWVVK